MKTTKEMIEVMQAYEKGEEIECKTFIGEKQGEWVLTSYPTWDWTTTDYRIGPKGLIKPMTECKFEIQDKVILKEAKELSSIDPDRYVFKILATLPDENGCILVYWRHGLDRILTDYLNNDYVLVNDCLWYWEVKTREGHWLRINDRRKTKNGIEEKLKTYIRDYDPSTLTPLYALGFKLPERESDE